MAKSSKDDIKVKAINGAVMSADGVSTLVQLLATWVIRDIESSKSPASKALITNRPILTFVQKDR